MNLTDMRIAVLLGGPGNERDVSLNSGKSVAEVLRSRGVLVSEIDVQGANFILPSDTDVAFNVIHGTFGEDGQLQEILEARGIRYTGAGVASSRLAFDKFKSKEKFIAAQVPTPRWEVLDLSAGARPNLPIPLVVKPPREGSSVGVHLVRSDADLITALTDARRYGTETLVEELIEGRELTVGILGDKALPIIHIEPVSGFYDMNNKYPWMNQGGKTNYHCPADLPADITARVQSAALAAHQSIGVEVYSRVDVLLRDDGMVYILEVNTIPGMTSSSLLPKAAAAAGIPFSDLCAEIVRLSLEARA